MLIRGTPDILRPPVNPMGFSGLDGGEEVLKFTTRDQFKNFYAKEFPWSQDMDYYLRTMQVSDLDELWWVLRADANRHGLTQYLDKIDQFEAEYRAAAADLANQQALAMQAAQAAAIEADRIAAEQKAADLAAQIAAEEARFQQAVIENQRLIEANNRATGDAIGAELLKIQDFERTKYKTVLTTSTVAADAMVRAFNESTSVEDAVQRFRAYIAPVVAAAQAVGETLLQTQGTGFDVLAAQSTMQQTVAQQLTPDQAATTFVETVKQQPIYIVEPTEPEPQVQPPYLVSSLPAGLDKMTIDQAAAVYLQLIGQGHTNGAIREAVEYVYGKQTDSDWEMLQKAAAQIQRGAFDFDMPLPRDYVSIPTPIPGEPSLTMPVFPEKRDIFEPPTLPYNLTELTLVQKRQVYANLRKEGYTDAEIRTAVENQVGKQSDADWALVSTAPAMVVDDKGRVEPPAAGGLGPLVLAVAAAYLLGA